VVGGSGFLAAYLAGLVVGNRPVRAYASIVSLNDAVTWLAQIVMFVGLGLLITPHLLPPYALAGISIALFLIFVARPAAVWACLAPFGFGWRENLFLSWAGMRGAVSIFLAAVPLLSNIDNAHIYFNVAFFVVVISLLFQGWTTRWAALRLRQAVPRHTLPAQRFEIDLPGQHDMEIVGYPILAESRALNIATMPNWMRIVLVVREGKVLEPSEADGLEIGDYAYVLAPALQVPRLDALFAAAADRPERIGTDWEFSIHGTAPLAELNTLYDLKLADEVMPLTIAQLFAQRFNDEPQVGDILPLGGSIMVATKLEDAQVSEAMLQFVDEELPANPAQRVGRRVRKVVDKIAKN
jgi:cell volume regulation protein A